MTVSPMGPYENDVLGNRIWQNRYVQNAIARKMEWDVLNRMTSACTQSAGARYEYRADGMRTLKVEGLSLVWQDLQGEAEEEVGSGFYDSVWATNKPTTRYFYDGQMPIEDDFTRLVNNVLDRQPPSALTAAVAPALRAASSGVRPLVSRIPLLAPNLNKSFMAADWFPFAAACRAVSPVDGCLASTPAPAFTNALIASCWPVIAARERGNCISAKVLNEGPGAQSHSSLGSAPCLSSISRFLVLRAPIDAPRLVNLPSTLTLGFAPS